MKAWRVVRKARPIEALELLDVDRPEPGPGELRAHVATTACNFNEVDGCHGRYQTVDPPLPYTLGMEAVGVVDAVGEGAEAWLHHRVMLTGVGATGAHAEYVIGGQEMAFDCPDTLDDVEGAAFYFPFHVAYVSLIERGRLRAGETALVHAGAGGVGSAAIQLAKAQGARVIATAGSAEKLDFCRKLGADVAINYRDGDFSAAISDATQGRGVDVACDLVGGEVTRKTMGCMAYGGRLMMTGFSGGIEAEDESGLVPRSIIFGNFALVGVLMAYGDPDKYGRIGIHVVPRERGEAIHDALLDLYARNQIHPVVGRRASFAELPQELERMERRETMGRTILDWESAGS
ncbi:MAG: alcohol dehydrogenase [Deltaproteobacteria bacterium]|nr:alcohol dehydrogenase [Deltaproteobacteria bacterium]